MANEVTNIEGPYEQHDFTVAVGTAISGGSLLVLSDPRTGTKSAATTSGGVFAGIAATDKSADDNSTNLGCYTSGIFLMTSANASVTAGAMVVMSGANTIRDAASGDLLTGAVVGKALETIAANTTGEVKVGGN